MNGVAVRFALNAPLIVLAVIVGAALGAAEMVLAWRNEGWYPVSDDRELRGLKNFVDEMHADRLRRIQARCDHYFVLEAKNTTAHLGPVVCVKCSAKRFDTLPSPSPGLSL